MKNQKEYISENLKDAKKEAASEKRTNVLESDKDVSRETILTGTDYKALYQMFRKDGMSRTESYYNALYLTCHHRYDESETVVQDRYRNIMEHPRGWSEDKKKLHKRNRWSLLLAFLDTVAGISRGVGHIKNVAAAFFRKIACIPKSMDSSARAMRAFSRVLCRSILPILAVMAVVYTGTTIAQGVRTRYAVGVYVDGIYAGNTHSVDEVLAAKHAYENDLTARYGVPTVLECEVTFRPCTFDEDTFIFPGDTTVFERYLDTFTKEGYGLYVDGTLAAVASAEKWFDDAIADYIGVQTRNYLAANKATEEQIDQFIYNNNITVIADRYPESYFLSRAELRSLFSLPELTSEDAAMIEEHLHFIKWSDFDRAATGAFSYTLSLDYAILNRGTVKLTGEDAFPNGMPHAAVSMEFAVIRDETERTTMAYETEYVYDEELYDGMRRLVREGKNGEKLLYYKATYQGDKLLAKEISGEEILIQPVNKIVRVGTKELTEDLMDVLPTGSYIYPYRGQITSDFGWRVLRGQNNFHQGLDIYGPYGEPVVAADGGEVIEVGYTGGYGKYCKIRHDEDTVTRYAHCASIDVEVGDFVAQGDTIGTLGATGNVTGVHVHFEIIENGETVDPLPYMSGDPLPYA